MVQMFNFSYFSTNLDFVYLCLPFSPLLTFAYLCSPLFTFVVWFCMACSQHFAGLPGGWVGGQGMAPGGVGGQLALILVGEVLALQPWCRDSCAYSL